MKRTNLFKIETNLYRGHSSQEIHPRLPSLLQLEPLPYFEEFELGEAFEIPQTVNAKKYTYICVFFISCIYIDLKIYYF